MIPVLIIHLETATDRKTGILKQFERFTELEPVFINGFDKKILNDDNIGEYTDFSNSSPRSFGEVACCISHRRALQYIIDNNLPGAAIIEDDVLLHADFEKVVSALDAYAKSGKNSNFIIKMDKLFGAKIYCSKASILKTGNYKVKAPVNTPTSACGYYVERTAAQTMFENWPKVSYVSDEWGVYKKKIKLFILRPFIVEENPEYGVNSLIGFHGETAQKAPVSNTRKAGLLTKIFNHSRLFIKTFLPISKIIYR